MKPIVKVKALKGETLISWTIALFPWLSIYGTFLPGISIGDFLLLIISGYSVLGVKRKQNLVVNKGLLYFDIYALFALLLALTFYGDVVTNSYGIFTRFSKFSLFLFTIYYVSPRWVVWNEFVKALKMFTFFAGIVIVIQYIVFFTQGVYLQFKIPFIPYCNDLANNMQFEATMRYAFRPSSLFLEPAHYTVFTIQYLIILVGQENIKRLNFYEFGILTLFLLLSVSSTAFILSVAVSSILFVRLIMSDISFGRKVRLLFYLVVLVFLVSVTLMNSETLRFSVERLMTTDEIRESSVWGRLFRGEESMIQLSGLQAFFGVGFGNTDQYMNSIYYIMYCTGYIGLLILVFFFIVQFFQAGLHGKSMIIVLVALCFSSPIIITGIMISYCVIMSHKE